MKKIFLIILLSVLLSVCCALTAAAQKLSEKDITLEKDPVDLSARTYQRLDKHGDKCALVKVRVIAPGMVFTGNVMGEVEKRGSEYWVYLTQGTKMFEFSSETFLPYRYYFDEPLEGGVTYKLTIQAPQPGGGQAGRPVENYLVLKVQPANANVFVKVDGMPKNVEDGTVTVSLADGPHTYSVDAVGFARQEGTVTMDGKRESRTITLVSTKPTLTVSATTPGTEIFINDTRKGTDSWSGELIADTYVVEGRLNGHRTHSQKVTLAEGQNQRLTIPALTPITGSLNVNYKPVDATITIDGREAGVTPNVIRDLLVGTHRVEISAPGYTTATLTANVTESTPATLSGSLTAKPSDPYADDIALTNEYVLFKDSSTGKYGFKHNRTIVIPARYDNAWDFSQGLARVEINGKRGFIDKSGTLVIPARYDNAWPFHEGLAGVKINGKYGFIDKSGTLVIPARYDFVLNNDGVYGFKNGKAKVELNGRVLFIDRKGNEISASGTSSLTNTTTTDNPNYERFKDPQTEKWGFKYNGKIVIPARYDDAESFSEGLARVEINGKRGFIDKSGILVIPARYDWAGSFSEGLAMVEINDKWGFIDKSGTLVIPARYDWAGSFHEGLAVVKINGKYGFIDKSGTIVIPARYDDVLINNFVLGFKNGKAKVELNGRELFIDRKGNKVK